VANNDLYYFWFRQYDARQGRWMGVDPISGSGAEPQTANRFTYAINSPPNLVDPLGAAAIPLRDDDGGFLWVFIGGVCGDFSNWCLGPGGRGFWDVVDRLRRGGVGVPVANCFLSGTCPGNIPLTGGLGDFIPDFTPECSDAISSFLPSCGPVQGFHAGTMARAAPLALPCLATLPVCVKVFVAGAVIVGTALAIEALHQFARRKRDIAQANAARREVERICGRRISRQEFHDLITKGGDRGYKDMVREGVN
jgi:RHS repeat-associated protein